MPQRIAGLILWIQRANREFVSLDVKPPPGPIALLIAFASLAIFFSSLERFGAALPSKSLFRRERAVDFIYWFLTPWVSRTLSLVATGIAIFALSRIAHPSQAWFESQSKWLQIVELLIAADLIGYATHRMFHRGALWRIHAIHHSAEDLDWLSATRVHPLNEVITRLAQLVPLYLLGFRGTALASLVPIFTFWAIFIHANINWSFGPLRYVIATPAFHRWHHTSESEGLDKNFAGLFPWIDVMFGTFYLPRGRVAEKFGVAGARVPAGLIGQMAYPFTR
jgi:sterol desaturase/sphingolipid hydroxylase (fatty acid hydroxylase superfamily)